MYTAGSCMLVLALTGLSLGVVRSVSGASKDLNQVVAKNQNGVGSSDDLSEAFVETEDEVRNNPLYERFTDDIFREVSHRDKGMTVYMDHGEINHGRLFLYISSHNKQCAVQ